VGSFKGKNVTEGGGGVKKVDFYHDIICGWPLYGFLLLGLMASQSMEIKKILRSYSAVFFFETPDINFSVMQKPFKKCVFHVRVSRFLHIRKKLIRCFQEKRQYCLPLPFLA
jgi:hypothetical protein